MVETSVQQWAYLVLRPTVATMAAPGGPAAPHIDEAGLQACLTQAGEQGWELTQALRDAEPMPLLIFRKPLDEAANSEV